MKLRVAALGLICTLGLVSCGTSGSGGGGLSNSGDAGSQEAAADGSPTGPVELIVPFDPGGGADLTARTVAQGLEPEVGQSVTVVNSPGAGGQIGATELSTKAADGRTIGLISAGVLTTLPLTRDTAYDLDSFEVIGKVAVSRQVLQVQTDAPWQTAQDIVDDARQNPGEFTFGTSGVGSTAHLAMAMFLQEAGAEAEHVVYDGLGSAKADLMAGNIDAVVGPVTGSDTSRIRPLVSFSSERGATTPDTPLVSESGYRTALDVIHYLVAPAGTPEATLDYLGQALARVSDNPATAEALGASELELLYTDGETSDKELQEYNDQTAAVVDTLGLRE